MADAESALRHHDFIPRCQRRFVELFGEPPRLEEVESWRNSWPVLLRALRAAELESLRILLEFSLPATGERIDALLLGSHRSKGIGVLAIELKQWSQVTTVPSNPGFVRAGGRDVLHPARQVEGYLRYLREEIELSGVPLHASGIALLHNASEALLAKLRSVSESGPSGTIPLVGRADVAPDRKPADLVAALHCTDLLTPTEELVQKLLRAPHRPSGKLLARAGAAISGDPAFKLIGQQDLARQQVWRAVKDALPLGSSELPPQRSLVVVTGGPGTGKTAIACRLLGDLCNQQSPNPRLLVPSGTIGHQLRRLLSDDNQRFVTTFTRGVPGGMDDSSVALIDEAHRIRAGAKDANGFSLVLDHLMTKVGVTVLFLDERQIIRPDEGVTLTQLEQWADHRGRFFQHVDLTAQFRCNGSQAYSRWIDRLFSNDPGIPVWSGDSYDLAVADSPEELSRWTDREDSRPGQTARISAGYCWPWKSGRQVPPLPEVEIPWQDASGAQYVWRRPWNFRETRTPINAPEIPGRPFWATDLGGNRQVGCVYTAQGMEYTHSSVILGRDVVRRDGRWEAHPQRSHDDALNGLTPERYMRYALNTYRVLATRGSHATRLYSTDGPTQEYLRTLVPSR